MRVRTYGKPQHGRSADPTLVWGLLALAGHHLTFIDNLSKIQTSTLERLR